MSRIRTNEIISIEKFATAIIARIVIPSDAKNLRLDIESINLHFLDLFDTSSAPSTIRYHDFATIHNQVISRLCPWKVLSHTHWRDPTLNAWIDDNVNGYWAMLSTRQFAFSDQHTATLFKMFWSRY